MAVQPCLDGRIRRDCRAGELRLLAVAALTAVGFFGDRLNAGLQRDAWQMLGGDAAISGDRSAPPERLAKAGTVLRTEPIGGEPETAVLGGDGLGYLNIGNTNELVVFDPVDMVVKRRHSLLPCKRPTARAIDSAARLYAACRNGLLVVSAADGQVVGSAKIGRGSDGVALLDGLAYSDDGADGTLSIVSRQANGQWATAAVVRTAYGSRTLAVDTVRKRLYLPAATFKTAAGESRPQPVAGTLSLWVLEPR